MANEDKATRYQRLRRRASVAGTAAVGVALGLAHLAGPPGFAGAGAAAGAFTNVVALTMAAAALLTVCIGTTFPSALYREAVLARRYGVLRERPASWVAAWPRQAAVRVALGTVAVAACAVLRALTPDWWWALGGAAAGLAPFAIAGLVTRRRPAGTPLANGALRDRLTRLAAKAGHPGLGLYQTTVGDRTRLANATVMTAGGERRVLISDTLLADHSDDEVEVVVAHELAHVVHHDVATSQAALAAQVAVSLYAVEAVLRIVAPASRSVEPAQLPAALLAGGSAFLLVRPLTLALSRMQERRADRFAVTLSGSRDALVSVVRRMAATNLAEPVPSAWTLWWWHSHPGVEERMRRDAS